MWYRIFHPIKNRYRRWRYGIGCCDLASLDHYLAKKILPALKAFRKDTNSYPCNNKINTSEQWDKTLDEMIWAFEYLLNDEENEKGEWLKEKDIKREFRGLKLFGQHYRDLWQ